MVDKVKYSGGFIEELEVSRHTIGHGESTLGVLVYLNFWHEVDFPGLKEGDKVKVQVELVNP